MRRGVPKGIYFPRDNIRTDCCFEYCLRPTGRDISTTRETRADCSLVVNPDSGRGSKDLPCSIDTGVVSIHKQSIVVASENLRLTRKVVRYSLIIQRDLLFWVSEQY